MVLHNLTVNSKLVCLAVLERLRLSLMVLDRSMFSPTRLALLESSRTLMVKLALKDQDLLLLQVLEILLELAKELVLSMEWVILSPWPAPKKFPTPEAAANPGPSKPT